MLYKILDYDVWGNAKDGYEINDVYSTQHTIEINELCYLNNIIKKLKDIDYLNPKTRTKFEIDDYNYGTIYITRKRDGLPICELRRLL